MIPVPSPQKHGPRKQGPILVLAATDHELRALFPYVTVSRQVEKDFLAHEAHLEGQHVVLAATGVGKSNAAMATLSLLRDHPARLTIFTGCAGAFPDAGVGPGDVVVADREVFADEGVMTPDGFLDLHQINLPAGATATGASVYNEVPVFCPPGRIAALTGALDLVVAHGPLVTVSTCSGTDEQARRIARRWHPVAETMEGAAAALAALRRDCPFMEVRGISNLLGDRDRGSWEIERACEAAATVVTRLIGSADELLKGDRDS